MKGQKRGEALKEKMHGWQEAVKERVDGMLATNSTLNGTQLAQKIEEERQERDAEKEQQKVEQGGRLGRIERKRKWKTELPDTLPEFDRVRIYIRKLRQEQRKLTGGGREES